MSRGFQLFSWILLVAFVGVNAQSKEDDRIRSLPGLTFEYTASQYSGFLTVPSQNNLHYWFLESQGDPSTDPLVLWLNGGPGCSSLVGMFTELGPFYNNPDGKTLFENRYSWNKLANIIFLESPRNVGFSYGENTTEYNDEKTTTDSADALVEFLKRYPEYEGRDFYVTGESYGGVYVPRLSEKILDYILDDPNKLPINFRGAAIGNGILNENYQTNSFVNLAYYRGISDYDETQYLRDYCCDKAQIYEYCNFSQYVEFDQNQNVQPKKFNDPKLDQCGVIVKRIVIDYLYKTPGYNKYSHEQSCYANLPQYNRQNSDGEFSRKRSFLQIVANQELAYSLSETPIISDGVRHFIDLADQRNTLSSDQLGGFPCFNNYVVETYLNRDDVRKAIHVDIDPLNNPKKRVWEECSDFMDAKYKRQTRDTSPVFANIKSKAAQANLNFKVLIYNGDADGVCNFLGDEWFIEDLAKKQSLVTVEERQQWYYQKDDFRPAPVGFYKTYGNESFLIDLVTVSGAGHYVPTYRPQPAFQMIGNFLLGERNYSKSVTVDTTPILLKNDYLPEVPVEFTRRAADQIFNLPGITFDFKFDQHSGYLKGNEGHYLHYWLIKSQANKDSDPLILWLNGGPGCSSLGGLLTELGPFRPNPDGKTISENVYAWNRAANLLFLEAPRNVGFSWQNKSIDPDTTYSDDKTIEENYLALKDFFEQYPEFKGKNFYVFAESYGGVYGPTLTRRLIQGIQSGDLQGVNLVGMGIGNGELSAIEQIRSAGPLMYHRGLIDKFKWDSMLRCCGGDYNKLDFCDVTKFVYLDPAGNAQPLNETDSCSLIFSEIVQKFWGYGMVLNAYNMYQDCYQQKQFVFGSRNIRKHKEQIRQSLLSNPEYHMMMARQASVNTLNNVFSTDNQGGFPCYGSAAAEQWLNTKDVRKALHIPDYVQNWTDCNDIINEVYVQQFNDTSDVFDDIINSGYPMRLLIYNGDVDLACNFIGDQWFIEKTAKRNNLKVSQPHVNWNIKNSIAGYVKQFSGAQVTIDLVTIKGAGHLVPTDRPEAALQMLLNFISRNSYNASIIYDTKQKPLLKGYSIRKQYSDAAGQISPLDLVSRDHPQLNSIRKYRAATNQKSEKVESAHEIPSFAKVDKIDVEVPPVSKFDKAADEVTNLPGFGPPPTKQYSGYLDITANIHMHYWLVKSYNTDPNVPLVLWLNGGPGCSSVGGLITENGPVRVNKDGTGLVENLFSWNRFADMLYLESPRGVGYSYGDPAAKPNEPYNDEKTARDNVAALGKFFERFPEYANRDFYITGESYGGVYVPTLVNKVLARQKTQQAFNINFKGFAIGNGILSLKQQINSAVHLMYYRGAYDKQTYESLLSCCPEQTYQKGQQDLPCDFSKYLKIDPQGNSSPNLTGDAAWDKCANDINLWSFKMVWDSANNVYNTYQDCYNDPATLTGNENRRQKRSAQFDVFPGDQPFQNNYTFIDQASMANRESTDAFGGFACYKKEASEKYLNRDDVKQALHIPAGFTDKWQNCNEIMNNNYVQQNADTEPVFESIYKAAKDLISIKKIKKFKVLIYNGDADMACEYLGDEWFIYDFAYRSNGTLIGRDEKSPWYVMEPRDDKTLYLPRIAGLVKHYLSGDDFSLDLLTVKGAGHLVPMDRPIPSLQMFKNYLLQDPSEGNLINYTLPLKSTDLLPQRNVDMARNGKKPSRRDMDEVFDLPGLTFESQFQQFSGYLTGKDPNNFLHYWLVESQGNSNTDPIVLWLTGGPGCSSMGATLGENGPFFVNPDGRTLFENVYSWNKAASILYLESPRGVGYSYQKVNSSVYNDDLSAEDVSNAVADFLYTHAKYQKRPFYITGESYGGVYVPTTSLRIMDELIKPQQGYFHNNMNFKGFLIGNGFLSGDIDAKTMLDFFYFHGLMGKVMYDQIRRQCCKPSTDADLCDLSAAVDDASTCQSLIDEAFNVDVDVYNIYQQCYENTVFVFGTAAEKYHKQFKADLEKSTKHLNQAILHKLRGNPVLSSFFTQQSRINYASTDQNGGFICYMSNQLEQYMNQVHVRDALHIPDVVQDFQYCSNYINENYDRTYYDMTPIFTKIINHDYVKNNFLANDPFRILLHNGDNDLACDHIQAEYFVESLKKLPALKGATVKGEERQPWRAYLPGGLAGTNASVAGWRKRFSFADNKVQFDLATVKGSGHFVPLDRPLAGFQLFANFINKAKSIDVPIKFSLERKGLKSQYKPLPTHPQSKHADATTPTTLGTQGTGRTGGSTNGQTKAPPVTEKAKQFASGTTPTLLLLFVSFFVYRFFGQNL